eukprot:279689-Prymnesium_polylepis.1
MRAPWGMLAITARLDNPRAGDLRESGVWCAAISCRGGGEGALSRQSSGVWARMVVLAEWRWPVCLRGRGCHGGCALVIRAQRASRPPGAQSSVGKLLLSRRT